MSKINNETSFFKGFIANKFNRYALVFYVVLTVFELLIAPEFNNTGRSMSKYNLWYYSSINAMGFVGLVLLGVFYRFAVRLYRRELVGNWVWFGRFSVFALVFFVLELYYALSILKII